MSTKVIYIMGWQRSGSTVVGNILGSAPGVCHVGELVYFHNQAIPGPDCGCGRHFDDCPLWSRVPERLSYTLEDWHALRKGTIRVKHLPRQMWEWRRHQRATTYAPMINEMYRAIGEVSGAEAIVDSTKSPAGALALFQAPDTDPYVLHVVRDPRAVAYSLSKRKKTGKNGRVMLTRSVRNAALRWAVANGTAQSIQAVTPPDRYLRVRYEDLMDSAPQATFQKIARWAGIDPDSLPFTSSNVVELAPTHTVGGNPNRFEHGATHLELDDVWRRGLSTFEKVQASAVAGPVMVRYGYPLVESRRR